MPYPPGGGAGNVDGPAIFAGNLYGVDASTASTPVGTSRITSPSAHRKPLAGHEDEQRGSGGGKGALSSLSIGEILQSLGGWDKSSLTDLQRQLYNAGYFADSIQPGDIHYGQLDKQTIGAFTDLLTATARANVAGRDVTWQDILNEGSLSDNQKQKAAGNGTQAPVYELANPADLVAVVQKAAQSALGHKLSEGQAAKFADHFITMQKGVEQAKYNAQSTNQAATITDQPDPATAADDYVGNLEPQGASSYSALQYFQTLDQMLSGSGG